MDKNENLPLTAALEYHRRGWCIIPVPYGNKQARIQWKKYQQTRPDENILQRLFSGNKPKNLAVVLGEVSGGLACRDFDTMPEYELWARNHPELAKILPTVKTAKGYHVYFEGHIEGRKDIEDKNGKHLGELRGSRCYCLLPPSIHPSGAEYEWVNPLFNGNLLCIDPDLAGFTAIPTEQTEKTEHTEANREDISNRGGSAVEILIVETLPKEYGTRNRQIFDFARALKSLPQFSGKDFNPENLRDIVRQWHKLALPRIRTKDFAVTWFDFLIAWNKVKYPKGEEPMAAIFEKAVRLPPPEKVARLYPDSPKLQILASLCRELQKNAGIKPFHLAVRIAAKYLHIDKDTAGTYLKLLVAEGILQLVKKGGMTENPRKASRYKFIANMRK